MKNSYITFYFLLLFFVSNWVIAQSESLDYKCVSLLERIDLGNGPKAVGIIHKNNCETGECNDFFSGVLVNNTKRDGRLLFLTTLKSGWTTSDYQNATIAFNWQKSSCESSNSETDLSHIKFKANHKVLYENATEKIVLLEIKKNDATYEFNNTIYSKLFFAGWKTLHNPTTLEKAYLIHSGSDSYKKVAFTSNFDDSYFMQDKNDKSLFKVNSWKYGGLDDHALGAPLLSTDGLVLGIYTGLSGEKNNIFRISESLLTYLDLLETGVSYILGASVTTTTKPLTEQDYSLSTEATKTYYFPNQQWNSSVNGSVLYDFNADKYFLEKNTLGSKEGLLASVISGGSGVAKVRVFQYLANLPKYNHPNGNTVKGTQLYASGATNISTKKYYGGSLKENDVITNGDFGLIAVGILALKKIAEDTGIFPHIPNIWSMALTTFFVRYAGDLSRLGFGPFWRWALTTGIEFPTNRADERILLLKIMGRGIEQDVGSAQNLFIDPFPGTNIKSLLQLELQNVACKTVNIPGLGKFNAVELFKPEHFKSLFSTNQSSELTLPDITVSKSIKGAQFEIKPIVKGTVFGSGDTNTVDTLFTSGHLSSGGFKFTAPRTNNMFLRFDDTLNDELLFAAANQTILNTSLDKGEAVRPKITHLGPLFKAKIKNQQVDYHLYKVTTTRSNLFLEAGTDGPFFINSAISVKGIQPTTVNDKMLNRYKYPNLALVAAHRGYWQEQGVPENTTKAFERSIALGADLMELDILKTHDSVYVLFHDDQVHRITDFTTLGIGVKDFNWDAPRTNVSYTSTDGTKKSINLPALNSLKLKDRFGTVTSYRIQTLEEGLKYLKPKQVFVTLDKMDAFIDDIYVMVLKLGMEDNVLFKGGITVHNQPAALKLKYGNIMQQINFTPVFFEQTPNFASVVEEFVKKEREEGWTISALEPQMKTDETHLAPNPGGVILEQHNAMKKVISTYRGKKWIGMASITPWHCGDGFLRADCPPETGFKIGCANYDWRADPDFCIDYVKSDYFITDRPRVIIDYLKIRGMH